MKISPGQAIVTSGTLPVAIARIKAANLPIPVVLITPEQVSMGKPDPEPYIAGANKLGVDVEKCIVFEDAPAGARSGVSAGAKVVGILTQFDLETLQAEKVSACVSILAEVTLCVSENKPKLSIRN